MKTADVEQVTEAGATIAYTFVVSNTGNVTLAELAIDESAFGGTGAFGEVVCPTAELAPGESVTCEAAYVVTQADIDAGSLRNVATATATPPGDDAPPVDSPPSEVVVEAPPAPSISLVKQADTDTVTEMGQEVGYRFVVTNTGNVTLVGVTVDEVAFSGAGPLAKVTCPVEVLLPAEVTVCTATYTVQAADLTGDPLVNTPP